MSTAPGAEVDLVISPTVITTDGLYVAASYEINSLLDPIMTMSYGNCEASAGLASFQMWNSLFQTAVSEGITPFVSAGDSGAECGGAWSAGNNVPTSPVSGINVFCASIYVTCVGGTTFNDTASPSTYWNDTGTSFSTLISLPPEGTFDEAINFNGKNQVAGSTGGFSTIVARPSWQTGTGVPTTGPAKTQRLVPDIAFLSSDHDGYFQCIKGDCQTGFYNVDAGTSAASPSMAGIMALVVQKYGWQGYFNPLLYHLANTVYSTVFHDVTVASSGVTGCVATTPSICNNSEPNLITPTGSGATATAVVSGGAVTSISITSGGSGYTQAPYVLINDGGAYSRATATTTVSGGVVTSISVTSGGSGYSSAPTITIAPNTIGYTVNNGYDMVTGWGSLDVNALMNANINYYGAYTATTTTYPAQASIADGTSLVNNLNATTVSGSTVLTQGGTMTYSATASGGAPIQVNTSTVLPPGTYTMTAIWQPNAFNAGTYSSSYATTTLVVLQPTVTLTAPASTVTIATQGLSYIGGIVATSAGYAGTVSLACTVTYTGTGTAVAPPGCTVSPSTLTLASNGSATAVVSLTTTPVTTQSRLAQPLLLFGSGGTLACLLICIPLRRFRMQLSLILLVLILTSVGLSGCGSSGSSSKTIPGTSTGNYTVTVTGTYSGTTTTSTTFTLTLN
jgi:subtilase family serine protease